MGSSQHDQLITMDSVSSVQVAPSSQLDPGAYMSCPRVSRVSGSASLASLCSTPPASWPQLQQPSTPAHTLASMSVPTSNRKGVIGRRTHTKKHARALKTSTMTRMAALSKAVVLVVRYYKAVAYMLGTPHDISIGKQSYLITTMQHSNRTGPRRGSAYQYT